ncbi:MAG: 30S ribosomal protein THX [Deltaproteobacteria bacterium CG_4_10_14_3_um_filter_60_8]|nr:MAG: ribosomal small subunit protein bTHX [Desulfobacterales bacterium CG2_30_60_27]PIP43575.1 MAG: 30S ribosomal protein THX [Deltaproteobacteria bacterium CG23_combo_of_CG06-09_8_20_14_all_60_8]PIY20140.1 MAG: 30S ribosomal protein THX [Deltaproteobacteria bacterium CG_4_10_14_3_um_filter_60_8]
MGRGDSRTKRGKIWRGTTGATRAKRRKGKTGEAAIEAAKEKKKD